MFLASNGWFLHFKVRVNMHNVKMNGNVISADKDAAREFLQSFKEIIEDGGYLPANI